MKRTLLIFTSIFLLASWVSADRHAATPNMYFETSFDFSRYPACQSTASRYCIQAVRFYDPDARIRLAEVLVSPGATGARSIGATVNVRSAPHHVYAVTVYRDGTATPKEGFPGQVSSFPVTPTETRERANNFVPTNENGILWQHPGERYESAAELRWHPAGRGQRTGDVERETAVNLMLSALQARRVMRIVRTHAGIEE